MSSLFSYFVNLCLFRVGPQDAPTSESILYATGIVLAISYTVMNTAFESIGERILVATTQVIIFSGVIWLLLKINNLTDRWRQTTIALFGSAAVLELAKMPFMLLGTDTDPELTGVKGPFMLHVLVGFWYLAIMATICKKALETSMGRGVIAAIFCQLSTVFGLLLVLRAIGLVPGPEAM